MLTALDESLLHQAALPIAQAVPSDHRFFDRLILGCFHPDGKMAFIAGMGLYKNMNVVDGFVFAQLEGKQYNVRFSQALHPLSHPYGSAVGPLSFNPIRPLQEVGLKLEQGDYPLAIDMVFAGVTPPRLEHPHRSTLDGRVVNDYLRYHQLGQASGWAEIAGRKFDLSGWFSWRDHSWGTRPNVGGFEPFTGTVTGRGLPSASRGGSLSTIVCHLGFWNGTEGGGVQFIENGEGARLYSDGACFEAGGAGEIAVEQISHSIKFHEGTRVVDQMAVKLCLEDGREWEVELDTLGRPFVYRGGGYDRGYSDGKGHGVFRSRELLIEQDIYDVSDIELVGFEDGATGRPVHREQFARARVNGKAGFAYTPCIVIGDHPGLGIVTAPNGGSQ